MSTQYKIIFSGPVGAGKTTAIHTISDVAPVGTEQRATDDVQQMKEMTTVAMDYGSMKLDDGNFIHLYGTPGQQRFDFMWSILANGAIGLIIVIDHQASDPLADLRHYIDAFADKFPQQNTVVAINKYRDGDALTLEDYHRELMSLGKSMPVLEIDARDKADVATVIEALLFNIDPSVQSLA